MEAWRRHESEGTDMRGLSPQAVFVHNAPAGGFKRVSEEHLAIATAEHYHDEAIAMGGIIELPDGTRYSHPLLTEYIGECREVIRLRYDHSQISVLPDQKGEELIVAPRRVKVGCKDEDELAKQAELQAKLKKLIGAMVKPLDYEPGAVAAMSPSPDGGQRPPLQAEPEKFKRPTKALDFADLEL